MTRIVPSVLAGLLALVPASLIAQGVGKKGSRKPPGCAAAIEYRVVAQKNPIRPGQPGASKTVTTWVEFRNKSDSDCTFVLCYMLDLKKKKKEMTRFTMRKNMQNKNWLCREDGKATAPPNFHFGCVQVSVPKHAGRGKPGDPELVVAPFKKADNSLKSVVEMGEQFNADELGSVYMDFLRDCPLRNCNLCKADQFLVPKAPEKHSDWVNVWVGGKYFPLNERVLGKVEFPMGNWVTMGDTTAEYPARLIGTFAAAPPGTKFTFTIPPDSTHSFTVSGDLASCRGNPLRVDLPYLIPADDNDAAVAITAELPSGPCGLLAEGAAIRFRGTVIAQAGAPAYEPGDVIVSVAEKFLQDSQPPRLVSHRVAAQEDGSIEVIVRAADTSSFVATVELAYSVLGGPEKMVPMQVSEASIREDTDTLEFSANLGTFSFGTLLQLSAVLRDEAQNETQVSLGSVLIGCPCPG